MYNNSSKQVKCSIQDTFIYIYIQETFNNVFYIVKITVQALFKFFYDTVKAANAISRLKVSVP